jgi:hypothetical protein
MSRIKVGKNGWEPVEIIRQYDDSAHYMTHPEKWAQIRYNGVIYNLRGELNNDFYQFTAPSMRNRKARLEL